MPEKVYINDHDPEKLLKFQDLLRLFLKNFEMPIADVSGTQ